MQATIDQEYSEVIATLTGDWVRKPGGSAIGTFITEAQREAAHADVAFMNDHGIRKDLSAGEHHEAGALRGACHFAMC